MKKNMMILAIISFFGLGISECLPQDLDGDGYTVDQGDCDDSNAAIYPGAIELCDGLDNNCDGVVDISCSDPKEVALCQETEGEWVEGGCGDYICGEPPPIYCFVSEPGCNCGPDKVFDPVRGCVYSASCEDPVGLCESTGGRWTECGSGCGPATCDNPKPGPECPAVCVPQCQCPSVTPYWDETKGCITPGQCQ